MLVEEAYATWRFSIILISLRVKVAQISNFLVHAKILPLRKAFFNLNLPHCTVYTGQERHSSYFFYIKLAMACSEVAFLQTAGVRYISNIF